MKRGLGILASIGLAAGVSLFAPNCLKAQDATHPEVQRNPIVIHEFMHDTSIPVRDMQPSTAKVQYEQENLPIFRRPIARNPVADLAEQKDRNLPPVAAHVILNFDGLKDLDGDAPPDTNASVGDTQVVETVNIHYQVYNKTTGAAIGSPTTFSTLFSGIGNCVSNGFFSDPVVVYDKAAARWLVAILSFNSTFSKNDDCVAISTTSDATGSYNRYDFSFGNKLTDYPKYGVWPDGYYFSANIFPSGGFFSGAEACAFDRNAMLSGLTAAMVCFPRGASDYSLMPSDLDGATPPPSGAPNFFVELETSTTMNLFKFHVDFVVTSNSTFTGPTVLSIPSYTEACAATGNCIPQSGTTTQLASLGDRVMFRLAYRNFGDHEAMVVTHSVKTATAASGVRWYEIRNPNSTAVVYQKSSFGQGSTSLWMASAAMDKLGDIGMGYSSSSSAIHPSIQITGRLSTDALNHMEAAANIFAGPGSQTGGLSRWGDYSSMSIDPVDDCTFWYAQEYIPVNGSFNWHTRLAAFKFNACN